MFPCDQDGVSEIHPYALIAAAAATVEAAALLPFLGPQVSLSLSASFTHASSFAGPPAAITLSPSLPLATA